MQINRFLRNDNNMANCAIRKDCNIADPTSIIPKNGMMNAYILSVSTNCGRSSIMDGDRVNGITNRSARMNIASDMGINTFSDRDTA